MGLRSSNTLFGPFSLKLTHANWIKLDFLPKLHAPSPEPQAQRHSNTAVSLPSVVSNPFTVSVPTAPLKMAL